MSRYVFFSISLSLIYNKGMNKKREVNIKYNMKL